MTITETDLDRWFMYHRPTPEQQKAYSEINAIALGLARMITGFKPYPPDFDALAASIEALCPVGEDRDVALYYVRCARDAFRRAPTRPHIAIRGIRTARMWANAAIACAAPSASTSEPAAPVPTWVGGSMTVAVPFAPTTAPESAAPEPEPKPRTTPVTRTRVDQMTPAELAIREAMHAVEAAGADPLLTEAVCLLEEASAKVYAFALEREKPEAAR